MTRLKLQFKGNRNYLQGPDIFDAALAWLGAERKDLKNIDFAFHRLTSRQPDIIVGAVPEGVDPVAVCSFVSDTGLERLYLVESDEAVTERRPYPEDELVARMHLDPVMRECLLRGTTEYSDAEVWVSMTKALHCSVFPQLQGKWLFVRGRFPRYSYHSEGNERRIRIAASFADKLTRSEALLDGEKVGEIFFSIV